MQRWKHRFDKDIFLFNWKLFMIKMYYIMYILILWHFLYYLYIYFFLFIKLFLKKIQVSFKFISLKIFIFLPIFLDISIYLYISKEFNLSSSLTPLSIFNDSRVARRKIELETTYKSILCIKMIEKSATCWQWKTNSYTMSSVIWTVKPTILLSSYFYRKFQTIDSFSFIFLLSFFLSLFIPLLPRLHLTR